MINPNDTKENSDVVSSADLPHSKPRLHSEDPSGKGSARTTHELLKSREEGDPKQFTGSPARHGGSDYAHRGHGVGSADNRKRTSRQSTGTEHNIDRSPLHRQAKTPGRDSPSWEGKNSYDSSHGTPGRSRLRPSHRGDETVLLFQSLVSGMRTTLHLLMATLTFSKKCGRRNRWGALDTCQAHLMGDNMLVGTNLPTTKLRVAAFAGAKNDLCEA